MNFWRPHLKLVFHSDEFDASTWKKRQQYRHKDVPRIESQYAQIHSKWSEKVIDVTSDAIRRFPDFYNSAIVQICSVASESKNKQVATLCV
jgi:hypothetical protein